MWYVYIVKCSDNTFYTGITTDVLRRVKEHNCSAAGAKYTRARRPVKLVYEHKFRSKSMAARKECEIKKLSRAKKMALIG